MRRRNLRDLGLTHTSAWMSLAQVTELVAMFSLGWLLLNWRLKWIFACGLGFGVLRFALSAVNQKYWLLAGVALHGASFALVYITAQIYLEQRVDTAWRARAQALLSLMGNGVGNLIGYLGAGWWFAACARPTGTQWPLFWGGLAAVVAVVLIYFLSAYRGKNLPREPPTGCALRSAKDHVLRMFSIRASSSPVKFRLRVAPTQSSTWLTRLAPMSALVTAPCRSTHASAICASVCPRDCARSFSFFVFASTRVGDVRGPEKSRIMARAGIGGNALEIAVGQHALGQRRENDAADAFLLQRREQLRLDPAVQHAVTRLMNEARRAQFAQHFRRPGGFRPA